MIIFYGPTGAGKSLQGQFLAMRHGWKWLSMGQVLRDTNDPEILAIMKTGQMVPHETTNNVISTVLTGDRMCSEKGGAVLDGYPRDVEQAQFLIDHENRRCGNNNIDLVIVIDMAKDEIMRRLALRGRAEDDTETIEYRLRLYDEQTGPILTYFQEIGVSIEHIDGVGTVGEVHDRIEDALESRGIAGAF